MKKFAIGITTFSGRLHYFKDFWNSVESFIIKHNEIDFLISDESEDNEIENFLKDKINYTNIKYVHHINRIGQMNQYLYVLRNLNAEWISIIEDDNIFFGNENFINEIEKLDDTFSLYVSAGISDYNKKDALFNIQKEFFGSKNGIKLNGKQDGLEIFNNFWKYRYKRSFSIDTNYMIYNKKMINKFFEYIKFNEELYIRPVITAIDHLLFKFSCLTGNIYFSKFPKMYKSQNEYSSHSFNYKLSNNIFSNYFVLYFIYQYCSEKKILNENLLDKWLFDGWDFLINTMLNYSMNDNEKITLQQLLSSDFKISTDFMKNAIYK